MFTICRYHNKLYVGGGFTKAGDIFTKYVATWDGQKWDSISMRFNGSVNHIMVYEDTLYMCGSFDSVGSLNSNSIIRYDGVNWTSIDFPNVGPVYSMQFYQDDLYVVGVFDDSSGNLHRISKWDHHNWSNIGEGILGSLADPSCFALYDDKLVVGGIFKKSDGNAGNNLQHWDGTNWLDLGGGTGGQNGRVWDMFSVGNYLWTGGTFSSAGNIPADKIARWDGNQWCGLGSIFNNSITSVTFYDDTLYIGGGFWIIDEDTLNYIAKWMGGDFVDTCSIVSGILQSIPNNINYAVHPNPASDYLYISFEFPQSTKIFVTITNLTGQKFVAETITAATPVIDISTLSSCIYFISIQTENGSVMQKFIKQ